MFLRWEKIAKTYAIAFLNIYEKNITEANLQSLLALVAFLKKEKKILVYLSIPSIPDETKLEALEKICHFFKVKDLVHRLLVVLLEHKRIEIVDKVIKKVIEEYWNHSDTISCQVSSSQQLTETDQQIVTNFVKNLSKKHKVIAHFLVDRKLLCGIKIKSRNFVWERSTARLLKDVEQSILTQVGL